MPNYTENDLQLAIQEVAEGVSIRKAANHHNIPYPTLRSRIQGTESRHEAHEWQQRLSIQQERQLCDWLIFQDKLARNTALTEANAKAGWKGSGLWPMDRNKALGSRFVIDDPNQTITVQSADPSPPRLNQRSENNLFTTPSHSRDVQSLVRSQGRPSYNSPTTRRLFRTIGKGLDTLGMKVLQLEEENKALKQQLAQSKKRKRAAVDKDPNKLFISIQNVRATRQRVEPLEQEIRVNIYGTTFTEEWPISRTPMQEAREAKARVQQFHEQQLRLDSESEEDVPNVRPQLPSPVGTEDGEERVSAQPTAQFVRSSRAHPPLKRKRMVSTLPTSADRRTSRRLRPRRQT
ncbi:Pogo transposable element with ZNF domain [Ilyonectria robusta]